MNVALWLPSLLRTESIVAPSLEFIPSGFILELVAGDAASRLGNGSNATVLLVKLGLLDLLQPFGNHAGEGPFVEILTGLEHLAALQGDLLTNGGGVVVSSKDLLVVAELEGKDGKPLR